MMFRAGNRVYMKCDELVDYEDGVVVYVDESRYNSNAESQSILVFSKNAEIDGYGHNGISDTIKAGHWWYRASELRNKSFINIEVNE